ncbi:MAG: polyphosphate kinase 1 [Acidimicrobiia bacterium]|nr:polyphosphate kinase 1 [Acidimicrobiia bacterium]
MDGSSAPSRFLNRELSWLDFDERVLRLATEPGVPLLERVKFSAIFSSNLDEFFQVRVAAMKDQEAAGVTAPLFDGLTPLQQQAEVLKRVGELTVRQQRILLDVLIPQLEREGVALLRWADLGPEERVHCTDIYDKRIFPVLTPLAVDPAHPFPYLSNLALSLAVTVIDPVTAEERFARIKVPTVFPRLVALPDGDRFVPVEEVIEAHLHTLFPGMTIGDVAMFRITRNVDLSVEDEEADDLLQAVELELRRRRFGRAVRLEVEAGAPKAIVDLLVEELDLQPHDVFPVEGLLDLSCLMQLHAVDRPDLKDDQWLPVTAGRLAAAEEAERSIFSVIRERALLVHHPYESFASSVEEFLSQAADDPRVQSIKMTLYRTSGDSPIARHLIRAAERGVQVAVLVELKARFDEAVNVTWAKAFERAGVHVVYGVVGLKTHAKCVLVVREDEDGLRRYVHLGTGNYNSRTSRLYEDLGYFTCEPDVTSDAAQLFNHLTGYSRDVEYRRLLVAPHHLRSRLTELIRNEGEKGERGHITIKVNSIADPDMIDELYAASQKGARVDLVVRGICCLRAGVPGLSENIRVRSVLGRFLEHSRVYRFANGQGDGQPLHLIGSADLMARNLDKRVEVLTPLVNPRHQEWLDHTFDVLLADGAPSFEMRPDASWERIGPTMFEPHPQREMYEWASKRQTRRVSRPT